MKIKHILAAFALLFFVVHAASELGYSEEKNSETMAEPVLDWYIPNQTLNKILGDLVKAQGIGRDDDRWYDYQVMNYRFPDQDAVHTVHAQGKTYAVAIQTSKVYGSIGTFSQHIVLLSPTGKIFDQIECSINCRYGKIKTEVLAKPDRDGALIVGRFVEKEMPPGRKYWCHYWHTIEYRGKTWTFWTTEREANEHSQWIVKGLCRLGIADDKFTVIFPKLEMPDLSKTKSLTVDYVVQGARKHLAVNDPKQVSDILSTIAIKSRSQRYPEPTEKDSITGNHSETSVEFFLPDGDTRKMAFIKNNVLSDARGGVIQLSSDAFFQALSKAVTKAEGRPVQLLEEKKKNQ